MYVIWNSAEPERARLAMTPPEELPDFCVEIQAGASAVAALKKAAKEDLPKVAAAIGLDLADEKPRTHSLGRPTLARPRGEQKSVMVSADTHAAIQKLRRLLKSGSIGDTVEAAVQAALADLRRYFPDVDAE